MRFGHPLRSQRGPNAAQRLLNKSLEPMFYTK